MWFALYTHPYFSFFVVFPSLFSIEPISHNSDTKALMTNVVKSTWHLFDAKNQTVGRFATHIATLLMGKHKPNYRAAQDVGDHVVIVNAKDVHFSGNKWAQKVYRRHTGYVGNLKEVSAKQWRETTPERILLHAIRGMIPKTKHKLDQMSRLKVFPGAQHTYEAMFPNAPVIQGSSTLSGSTSSAASSAKASAQPIAGLTDTWDFPPSYPESAKQEIFSEIEYKRVTPDQQRVIADQLKATQQLAAAKRPVLQTLATENVAKFIAAEKEDIAKAEAEAKKNAASSPAAAAPAANGKAPAKK